MNRLTIGTKLTRASSILITLRAGAGKATQGQVTVLASDIQRLPEIGTAAGRRWLQGKRVLELADAQRTDEALPALLVAA